MDGRVEGVALGSESGQADVREHPCQLVCHCLERSGFEIAVLAGSLEVVENRKKLRDDGRLRVLRSGLLLAVGATPVVGVLRRDALQICGELGDLRVTRVFHYVTVNGPFVHRVGLGRSPGAHQGLRNCVTFPYFTGLGIDLSLVHESDRFFLGVVRRHFLSVSSAGSSTTSASTTPSSAACAPPSAPPCSLA